MSGETVPDEWQGGMNVTYTFGGSFKTPGWYLMLYYALVNGDVNILFPLVFNQSCV